MNLKIPVSLDHRGSTRGRAAAKLCSHNTLCNGASGQKQNTMLQQFTWQQFLVATAVLTMLWYLGVILIFYRREVLHLFGKSKAKPINEFKTNEPLPHRWESGVERLNEEAEEGLIGGTKLPEGMDMVGTEDIGFAPRADGKEQQIGLVPDVLQEIREVFSFLASRDGSKKDFYGLMETVRDKYPKIGSNPNIGRINDFIIANAPFHLSEEELENLWD